MELVLTWRPTLETARRFVQCLHPKMRRHSDPGNGPPPVSHCPLNDFASSRPPLKRWVEHRLFSFISSNWRGEPLCDYETIVRLIAATTTAKGLKVTCRLDRRRYPLGREITDEEMASVNLVPDRFHGEWNYTIRPSSDQSS